MLSIKWRTPENTNYLNQPSEDSRISQTIGCILQEASPPPEIVELRMLWARPPSPNGICRMLYICIYMYIYIGIDIDIDIYIDIDKDIVIDIDIGIGIGIDIDIDIYEY